MFKRFFKKEKPRVYLGSLVVAARSELKKSDEWGMFKSHDLEAGIREKLSKAITLPHASTITDLRKSDLALDIVVVTLQGGEFHAEDLGFAFVPFFWRPKVEIRTRLQNVISGETVASVTVKEKMPWKQYLNTAVSFNGIFFRYKPLFSITDVEVLLYQACMKAIVRLKRAV